VAFIANAYANTLQVYPNHYRHKSLEILIRPVIQNKLTTSFYGKQWNLIKPVLKTSVPRKWIKGYLEYTEAHKVYSSSKIILGLQNQRTQLTQRTYEILGSGGFLLTTDTDEIRRLFVPGRHLVTASSSEETVELIKYYLKHPDQREKIQKQGLQAVSAHDYRHRAAYMIKTLRCQKIIR
jgi:spore maturation protein CgeB